MNANQLIAHGKPGTFQFRVLPDPIPGPEDVVIRVGACGLNRLDLWLEEGGLPIEVALPRTPGCEIAGTVEMLGDDVDEWHLGDRVAVQSNLFCGECEFCLRGEESLCLKGTILGVQCDGGFAEKVVVPWRSLVKIPDNVSLEASAALALAASTAMHMLTDRVEVHEGEWVLVMAGASGVGSAAVQIAKRLGAQVITTASTTEKREFCLQLGADHVVDARRPNWTAEVRRITQNRGVSIVVEHIGGHVLEQVFQCLARDGSVVTCGATIGRTCSLNLWPFFVKQQRLIGSYGRNRTDLVETLDWAAQGRLKPVIHRIFPLAEVPRAYQALRDGLVKGKCLIQP